jgi:type I restriction enzyme, S subunit
MQKTHQMTAHGRPLMGCCISMDNLPYEKIGKNGPVCIADEVPFEIPDSWEWVRLGNIFQHNTGKALNSSNHAGKLMEYITTSNLYWDHFEIDKLRSMLFTDAEIEKCTAIKGDLLVCEGGDIGRAAIWNFNYDIRIQNHIHRLRAYLPVCTEYFYYLFYLYKHAGWIGGKGIGIQGLSSNALHAVLFPFPPLEEQKRIVEKIVELQPYLNRYEEASSNAEKLNLEFPDQLKKSILQYAVQGKLVPQDPNDEPASVLLERIRAEKEQLIKAGKIKRDKHESVIVRRDNSYYEKIDGIERCIDDEIPFDVPDNWTWCRFGTALINRDCERIPLSVDERAKLEKIYDYYGASGVIDKVDRFLFNKPLLLIGEDGANLLTRSKPIAFIASGLYWVNNHAHVLDSTAGLSLEYVSIYINAINLAPYVSGTAQPKMNQENMNAILLAIPPVAEQRRIVAKINEILPALTTM